MHTVGVHYRVVLVESAMRQDGTCVNDKDVHNILERKRFKRLNHGTDRNEWFKCTVEDIRRAIDELKTGRRTEEQRELIFGMRREQQTAVDMTAEYFERAKKDDPGRPPKFLWNAKMRFGKTFATYELAKKMGFKKILVLTFKPPVESA